jgi:tetratricopeptide (TPR) repeat protein
VGIVHRDFKPENVMIGRDGRPRVADFGLARDGVSATGPAVELAPLGDRRLTATGAVLGTPAYMSPEQFAGHEVGPASDQFSFCVVAYEALFGRRPFRGRTTAELAASVTEGEVRGPPPRSGVPAALTRAVLTGLRADPTERHTSMAALVEALEGVVRARRRRVWLGVAAGVGVVALGLGYRGALALRPGPCEAVAEALGGAWDDARREAVATAVPDAAVQAIDAWASAWIEERRTACEETNVRGERSDFELGLRMACLDRHAARLDGFTAGLAETENADIGAERVDDMLPRLEDCRDVNTLDKHYNRFDRESERDSTAEDRAHLEALRLLSRANTRHLMYRDGAEELVAEAEAIMEQYGLHELDDTALALRADLAVRTGDRAAADALRMRSAEAAVATGDDALAADAIRLRADAALDAGDLSAARTHLQYFDLFVQRVAADDIRKAMEVKATVTRGNLALAQGKTEEAIGHFEQVMAAPDLQDPYDVRMGLGSAYLRVGRVADAVEQFEGALAERRAKGITDDPELAGALVNLANARMELGQLDAAVEDLRTAHGILERAGGDQRNLIGIVLGNWGLAERHRGDLERARELQEESLRVRTEALGEAHPLRAFATDELGELARLQRDWDAAQRWFEQSIALRRAAFGDEHPGVAASLTALGRVHLDRGAPKEAREVLTEARRILTATEQQDAEMIADVDALLERAI